MLKVKPIPFPLFDEWIKRRDSLGYYQWSYNAGHVWFEVEMFCGGRDSVTYAFAIAANAVPSNIWVDKIFWEPYEHQCPKESDSATEITRKMTQLRLWYESTVEKANERWREYITKNYLIDDEVDS